MKSYILGAVVGTGGILANQYVKQDGSGGVVGNDGAATAIGMANATKVAGELVGVIVSGIVKSPLTDNATYSFGDKLELKADGQTLTALAAGTLTAIAIETKTTTAPDNGLRVLLLFI